MNSVKLVEFRDYEEPLSAKVGKWLMQYGLKPANGNGEERTKHNALSVDNVGVLMNGSTTGTGFLDFKRSLGFDIRDKINPNRRRIFLGVIWFRNSRGATEQNWIFDMKGRQSIKPTKKLADSLGEAFGVKITLRLVDEEPALEIYGSDYGM